MDTRTPFEIRLELLRMSKEYLDTTNEATIELFRAWVHALNTNNAEMVKTLQDQIDALKTFKPYTIEDVVKYAQQLQEFVSKRS